MDYQREIEREVSLVANLAPTRETLKVPRKEVTMEHQTEGETGPQMVHVMESWMGWMMGSLKEMRTAGR